MRDLRNQPREYSSNLVKNMFKVAIVILLLIGVFVTPDSLFHILGIWLNTVVTSFSAPLTFSITSDHWYVVLTTVFTLTICYKIIKWKQIEK